ncbi:POU domain, class 6, transcription factor 2 [Collichthys lucidus]|uniref:POU domain protein n=1 Tax=Collichthys lucidus TaxID=240159 RepID=A0A4U5VHQ8_COLLU|nr:POU domain, class 6, transcription factor 2 [Collichthys lucidus]
MITGQLSKPLLSLRSDMSAAELRADDKAATPDSDLNDEPLLLPSEATDREGSPNKLYGARDGSVQSDTSSSPSEQSQLGQSHPGYPMGPQSLLVAQQLANAVGGVMSGAAPGMNQPILIPFNAGGHLGGQQGLVLSLPTANIQSLVAAAAAGGIMTLPLQNLQAAALPATPAQPVAGTQPPFARHPAHAFAVVSLIAVRAPHWACPLSIRTLIGLNPLASQVAAAAAMGSIAGSQVFGNTLSNLQGATGQLVTNAQGQIIGTIPLMPNSAGPSSQSGGGNPALQVQPITPQLLTNAQGQIIATVIGNQILPVINTQGITLSPIKPGQQASSSSSTSSSSSALSVGQLVSNPQTAPSEVDGVNLEEIREFAKAFKIRRLSLGLTQTQVGQALSAAEGPAYSQSAICRHTILRSHFFLPQEAQENTIGNSLTGKLNPGLLYPARFEKLDITPKSAQKIKPVLERWMAEAEARHRSGMQNLTEFIGSEPSKKRKRRTSFTPQALEILNSHFEKNTHPSGQEMTEIAEKLNYDREVVRVWFCNKRQALKNTIKRLKQPDLGPAAPMDPLTDSLEELPK